MFTDTSGSFVHGTVGVVDVDVDVEVDVWVAVEFGNVAASNTAITATNK